METTMENKSEYDTSLMMAEQQFVGFVHARLGGTICTLAQAMGLSQTEWEQLKADGMLWLDDADVAEIDEMFAVAAQADMEQA